MTRALAIEFASDKIRVNAIAPAVVETPLFDPLLSREQLDSFNAFHPIGRNGVPHDITAAVLSSPTTRFPVGLRDLCCR